jgi:hypothetical protein
MQRTNFSVRTEGVIGCGMSSTPCESMADAVILGVLGDVVGRAASLLAGQLQLRDRRIVAVYLGGRRQEAARHVLYFLAEGRVDGLLRSRPDILVWRRLLAGRALRRAVVARQRRPGRPCSEQPISVARDRARGCSVRVAGERSCWPP